MLQTVVQVKPTPDFKVYVYFSDGKVKLYDAAPLLNQGVFKQLADVTVFMDRCTVMNGTLAWDIAGGFDEYNCLDIAPETIYADGADVRDPLSEQAA